LTQQVKSTFTNDICSPSAVVLVCSSTEAALSEIPERLKSDNDQQVALIIVGGLYPPEDVEKIKAAADAVRPVPFFVADRSKVPAGATGPPPPEIIKQRILGAVEATQTSEGVWEPTVHKF
jgi:hypothetical protein